MQIGDLVTTKNGFHHVGVIIGLSKNSFVYNEAHVAWNDGTITYIAVWALEALCKSEI